MPKLLVLFDGRTGGTAALADAVAEGARSVRFMEVDVRRVGDGPDDAPEGRRHRALDAPAQAADYDAIVLGAHVADGAMPAVEAMLGQLQGAAHTGTFTNKVASAFAGGAADDARRALLSLVEPMAALGMIVVPPGPADPSAPAGTPLGATSAGDRPTEAELAAARHQGRRVALVADWVTHGLGHMHGSGRSHGHGHEHEHSHGHAHSHEHGGHHHG